MSWAGRERWVRRVPYVPARHIPALYPTAGGSMRTRALSILAATLAAVTPLLAQEPLPSDLAARVSAIANESASERRQGDFSVPTGTTLATSLVVLDGTLELAGHVQGDVLVLNGSLDLAPGAQVDGAVIVVGGELEGADEARVGGEIVVYEARIAYCDAAGRIELGARGCAAPLAGGDEDDDDIQVTRDPLVGDDLELVSEEDPARSGRAQFLVAAGRSYNRVEGLPIRVGPTIETGGSNPFRLRGVAIFRTEDGPRLGPERWGYDVGAEQFLGGEREIRVGARVFSVVDPIEEWHLTDLENSLGTFFLHRDFRDHYEIGRASCRGEL